MKQLRAIFNLLQDTPCPNTARPLMLERVLFCPVLRWTVDRLILSGTGRFFVVCTEEYVEEVRTCFPADADVTISDRPEPLEAFLAEDGPVTLLTRPVVPIGGRSEGVCVTEAHLLREQGISKSPQEAVSLPGYFPFDSLTDLQTISASCRQAILSEHMERGVTILDPAAVYVDPRVQIGAGTMLLPGTILRGDTVIGSDCEIGPNTMIRDCTVGNYTTVNASQANESQIGSHTNVGPFAYIRPNSVIGDHIKVGDFVEVKNSVIGDGTKISHLTYVGDSDVGERVNFGCGTVTTNYDGFNKHRTIIGDDAFIGCNTNLVAPVRVGSGAYTAAGTTVTKDVPDDSLAIGRPLEAVKSGWAKRFRTVHEKRKKQQGKQ